MLGRVEFFSDVSIHRTMIVDHDYGDYILCYVDYYSASVPVDDHCAGAGGVIGYELDVE